MLHFEGKVGILFTSSPGVDARNLKLEVTEISLHTMDPHFRPRWPQKEFHDGEWNQTTATSAWEPIKFEKQCLVWITDHPELISPTHHRQTSSLPTKTRQRRSYQASDTTRSFNMPCMPPKRAERLKTSSGWLFGSSSSLLSLLTPIYPFPPAVNVHSLRTVVLLQDCHPKVTVYEAPELSKSASPKVPSL
ncbi:hypothetical protein OG21DRAFT_1492430 [Imleria badia]|nr:hypothetical protein OG21DRAFT_1492430 [Imleria badia]